MKKFFSYFGWALLLAAVIAAFTATGKEQCKQYIAGRLTPGTYVNLTVTESPVKILGARLFSFYTVSYYKPVLLPPQQGAGNYNFSSSPAVAALKANSGIVVENYLGIFNSFWKW